MWCTSRFTSRCYKIIADPVKYSQYVIVFCPHSFKSYLIFYLLVEDIDYLLIGAVVLGPVARTIGFLSKSKSLRLEVDVIIATYLHPSATLVD